MQPPKNTFFKSEGTTKIFSDKENWRKFSASRLAKETLKVFFRQREMKPDGSSEIHEGMTSNKNDKHMERFKWILLQRHNKSIVIFNKYIYAKKICMCVQKIN